MSRQEYETVQNSPKHHINIPEIDCITPIKSESPITILRLEWALKIVDYSSVLKIRVDSNDVPFFCYDLKLCVKKVNLQPAIYI